MKMKMKTVHVLWETSSVFIFSVVVIRWLINEVKKHTHEYRCCHMNTLNSFLNLKKKKKKEVYLMTLNAHKHQICIQQSKFKMNQKL